VNIVPQRFAAAAQIASRCPQGRDVVLDRVNGGGRRIPRHFPEARFPKLAAGLLGPQNGDIDGTDMIRSFFRRTCRRHTCIAGVAERNTLR
jgi:polyhydroxybutyrate depolymerase